MQSYWLWLALHPGLNAAEKRCLLEYFPTPDRLYAQAPEAPEQPNLIPLLRKLRDRDMTEANRVLTLCREKGIRILPFDDPAYPSRLRQLNDAPVVLYCRGILPELNRVPVIGVVGTRQASSYGLKCARTLSAQLCACGAAVISGGADNGRHLVVFKDSYANTFLQFAVNDYETIHVIDLRYFAMSVDAYLEENVLTLASGMEVTHEE